MKYMDVFVKVLEELTKNRTKNSGKLKGAWFTTFNMDLNFIDQYIIPLLAFKNDQSEKRKFSFNQLAVFQAQDTLKKQETDIRFYYDERMLNNFSKLNCFPVIGVNPKRVAGSHKGVFHPKLVFLWNKDGKAYLIAGSGNLTVSGWGRNRESVISREVKSQKNFDAIIEFFKWVDPTVEDINTGFSVSGKDDWEFICSSAEDKKSPLLSRLLTEETKDLLVWSPYFSSDPKGLIGKIQEYGNPQISLIPDVTTDVTTDETVRIDNNKISDLSGRLFSDKQQDGSRFSHVKLWLTESKIAVGSWNFTEAALGLSTANNIEAGILLNNDIGIPELNKLEGLQGLDKDTLINEKPKLDFNGIDFSVSVVLNWETHQYTIKIDGAGEDVKWDSYKIHLPGVNGDFSLPVKEPIRIEIEDANELLRHPVFRIYQNEEEKYIGFVIETNIKKRLIRPFDSLQELMDSVIEKKLFDYQPPDNIDPTTGETIYEDEIEGCIHQTETLPNYFSLFKVFENIREEASDEDKKNAVILWLKPLIQKELLKNGKETLSIYQKFLVYEFNRLCEEKLKISSKDFSSDEEKFPFTPEQEKFLKEAEKTIQENQES